MSEIAHEYVVGIGAGTKYHPTTNQFLKNIKDVKIKDKKDEKRKHQAMQKWNA